MYGISYLQNTDIFVHAKNNIKVLHHCICASNPLVWAMDSLTKASDANIVMFHHHACYTPIPLGGDLRRSVRES